MRKQGDALRLKAKALEQQLESLDEAMHAAFGTARKLVTMEMAS